MEEEEKEVEEADARDSLFPPRRPRPVPSSSPREEVLVAAVEDDGECFILKHNQVIMCNFVWRAGICIFTLLGRAFGRVMGELLFPGRDAWIGFVQVVALR